ncbi:MAG: TIGR01777 family oxidoreductase [Proteobacteria bacterium]|nr:TIGR01777 family oxidoreductase [Pseudomonadota bacterium]
MYIVVTGGTGFIGRALVAELMESGHSVAVPSRSPESARALFGPRVDCVAWDGRDAAVLVRLLDNTQEECAVVNLVGEGLADGRWDADKKKRILESRVHAATAVNNAAMAASRPPAVIIQGSAVGYYGSQASRQDRILDEASPLGTGFLAQVCAAWETAGTPVEATGLRRVVIRTGLVIGPGGMLAKFLPPFRWFAGGPLGDGDQWLSWIHLSDMVRAIVWLLENGKASGAYNLSAPMPVTMRQFCKTLGRCLGRPSWLPVPSAVLRLMLGREMADETVLASQRAVPVRLLDEGYGFRVMELESALVKSIRRPVIK